LIIFPTSHKQGAWLHVFKLTEASKLCRVKIDIDNKQDKEWGITVKKEEARLPELVKQRIRELIPQITTDSKRTLTRRGRSQITSDPTPVWTQKVKDNLISYGINFEHPVAIEFLNKIPLETKTDITKFLAFAGMSLPLESIYAEKIDNQNIKPGNPDANIDDLCHDATLVYKEISGYEPDHNLILRFMEQQPSFKAHWNSIAEFLTKTFKG